MIRLGRALTIFALVAFALVGSQGNAHFKAFLSNNAGAYLALNLVAGFGAMAVFASWWLAFRHLRLHFDGDAESKQNWGRTLTFGMFVGGWVYWITRKSKSTP